MARDNLLKSQAKQNGWYDQSATLLLRALTKGFQAKSKRSSQRRTELTFKGSLDSAPLLNPLLNTLAQISCNSHHGEETLIHPWKDLALGNFIMQMSVNASVPVTVLKRTRADCGWQDTYSMGTMAIVIS
ncbi:hypothetical protein Q8A73_004856 [Channa argus]|nr:hypothetical protein Q8A73_004856 [Channa argus]